VKGQGTLNKHMICENVLMLLTENYQN